MIQPINSPLPSRKRNAFQLQAESVYLSNATALLQQVERAQLSGEPLNIDVYMVGIRPHSLVRLLSVALADDPVA